MATTNTDIVTALQNNGKILGQIQAAIAGIAIALAAAFPPPITGTAAWSPGSLASGSQTSTTVTATGASLGDFAQVSLDVDLQDQIVTAYVSAADTVTVVLLNETGGSIDLGAVSVNVRTFTL